MAVIGAGPYGLSIAAHLRSRGVEFRIFGEPMRSWRAHMPRGMFLKSEGFASNLSDATGNYTLSRYCADEGFEYSPYGAPVSLDVFTRYGLSFQERFVPEVENALLTRIDRTSKGFELRLTTGEILNAAKVVIATGISHSAHIPKSLANLPCDLLSHSSSHYDLCRFTQQDVVIIGGGQSALETAALLHEAGARVQLVIRQPCIRWNETPSGTRRSLYDRLRRPMSKLGPGLGPWLYSNAPNLFCRLPQEIRIARVQKALGPAGAWWLKARVVPKLRIIQSHFVRTAEAHAGRAVLHLQGLNGEIRHIAADHVIAATGYRFSLRALPFLTPSIVSELRAVCETPVLSRNFESSVPGLYFTGLASANQFGPAMRFLHGAGYTAKYISRDITAGLHRRQLPASPINKSSKLVKAP